MRISKNSWHYRVWKFTYAFNNNGSFEAPEQTNLCRYMRRMILYPVPVLLAIIVIYITLGIFFLLPNIATVLVGYGTITLDEYSVFHINHFHRITVRGRTIPMWAIVIPAWLLVALAILIAFFPSQMGTTCIYASYGVGALMVVVFALYVLYPIIATIVSAYRRWEGLDIAKEYLKAKKQKLCPIITFDESERQSSAV